jgi:hypothetical protein
MLCENELFIDALSLQTYNHLLELLGDGTFLFQTFIPLDGTRKETYGTDSDVCIEYIDIETYDLIIHLHFYTHDTPCIQFCTQIAHTYNISVQLVYFNKKGNVSGELGVYCSMTKYEHYNYIQGVYLHRTDDFWEFIHEYFVGATTFMEFLTNSGLHVFESDLTKLQNMFNEFLMFGQFEKL